MPLNDAQMNYDDEADESNMNSADIRNSINAIARERTNKNKQTLYNPSVESSPTQMEEKRFTWWADEAAESLRDAVRKVGDLDDVTDISEQESIAKNTACISRQIAKQVPDLVYGDIVGALRGNLKMVENACQVELDNAPSPTSSANIQASNWNFQLGEVLGKGVPAEVCKYLERIIYSELTDEMYEDDNESTYSYANSDTSSITGEYDTKFPKINSDIRLSQWDASPTSGRKMLNVKSSDSVSSVSSAPASNATKMQVDDRDHVHRKFYHDNSDQALQLDAFKKFCIVLVNGRGFRVVKHNHNGGRNTRILKYNSSKNRVYWESSKILGGEYVNCTAITRVKRAESVVYVWHTTGSKKGKKKMVGFETQREYDARVLELALLYLLNKNLNGQEAK
eukprot:CAMPEP_0171460984 /NCGR_PEP_ID=MMETSP0945-20130129/5628_1 /TAXON_ID=109269 /ORGANISM="Vaucheria litorea, Strain CCMP2940" /LENGTH=395 /DNA_ID=CAMNT_0011987269 /DNA_START=103 /DNA_END=1290 /DNA_ORIENTATION=+